MSPLFFYAKIHRRRYSIFLRTSRKISLLQKNHPHQQKDFPEPVFSGIRHQKKARTAAKAHSIKRMKKARTASKYSSKAAKKIAKVSKNAAKKAIQALGTMFSTIHKPLNIAIFLFSHNDEQLFNDLRDKVNFELHDVWYYLETSADMGNIYLNVSDYRNAKKRYQTCLRLIQTAKETDTSLYQEVREKLDSLQNKIKPTT